MADRSKMVADTVIDGVPYGVFYYPSPQETFGAARVQRLAAVYESPVIDGGSYWLAWKELSWVSSTPDHTRLYVFVKSASSVSDLDSAQWGAPVFNNSKDLAGYQGRYMRISMVLYSDGDPQTGTMDTPVVSQFNISSHVSSGALLFFSKVFSLGFKPRHILLTYNGTIPENAMVQFAVAGKDTADQSDYQIIEPNRVASLDDLPYLADSFKIMFRATGSTEVPFIIDEFAVAISGEGQTVIQ